MDLGAPRDGDMPEGLKVFVVGDGSAARSTRASATTSSRSTSVGADRGRRIWLRLGRGRRRPSTIRRPKVNFGNDAARRRSRSRSSSAAMAASASPAASSRAMPAMAGTSMTSTRAGVVPKHGCRSQGQPFHRRRQGRLSDAARAAFRVGPVVALDYAKAKVDGYTEIGDPALTLNVDSAELQVAARQRRRRGARRFRRRRRPAPPLRRGDDREGLHRRRPDRSTFAQTSAPTIVNSFALEDASKKPYGRLSAGLSAAILSTCRSTPTVAGTVGKDQGNETSAQLGPPRRFLSGTAIERRGGPARPGRPFRWRQAQRSRSRRPAATTARPAPARRPA